MNLTVKSLRDIGALRGELTTDAKADALLAFIVRYQATQNGQTPAYNVMANEIGIPEEAIKILLGRLENRGKLFLKSRNPPAILLTPDQELETPQPGTAKAGAYGRYLDAEGRRHALARFIGEHEATHGSGPDKKCMMEAMQVKSPAYLHAMLEIMADRGLIQKTFPVSLTDTARQLYGFTKGKDMQPQSRPVIVVSNRPPRKGPARTARVPRVERAEALCRILAEYQLKHGQKSPGYAYLGGQMGYKGECSGAVSEVVKVAIYLGYLMPKKPQGQDLVFSEAGYAKFVMPRTGKAAEPQQAQQLQPEPAPQYTPPPIVPEPTPTGGALTFVETANLIMELIDRGYTVKKN